MFIILPIILGLINLAILALVIYITVKTAINKSELIDVVKESRALSTQQSWQHKENKEQMEELKNLLREQNALLKELISQKSGL